ncbi:MAG: sugar transferase [Planctomycetota bacterium]
MLLLGKTNRRKRSRWGSLVSRIFAGGGVAEPSSHDSDAFLKRFLGGNARVELGRQQALLLTPRQFERRLNSERLRCTRRRLPFCIVTIQLREQTSSRSTVSSGRGSVAQSRSRIARQVTRILVRHLRVTDEKGFLARGRYGVLLVDTPEMGGRAVVDRLKGLFAHAGIGVDLEMQVHDPEGFGDDQDDQQSPAIVGQTHRRRDDPIDQRWDRPNNSDVDDTAKDAIPTRSVVSTDSDAYLVTSMTSPMFMRVKRAMDLAGASLGLLAAGPFLMLAAAAIKLTDGGPVFFSQTREGKHGRPFTIYKLRTMCVDAERRQASLRSESHRDGPAFKISRDPRVTRVGHFLRATCLDELPQLINVLKGDMAIVGPRPLPWHESRACCRWHRRRLDVRPGLTCSWQANKARAETFDDWMRMDLRYIDRLGLVEDIRLIARTVLVPITGRGGE